MHLPDHNCTCLRIFAFAVLLLCLTTHSAKADAKNKAASAKLDKTVAVSKSELTLGQALELIEKSTGVTIKADWTGLDKVGIAKDDRLTIPIKKVDARVLLGLALDQASAEAFDGDKAGYTLSNGGIQIATRNQIDKKTIKEDYDMRRVLAKLPNRDAQEDFIGQFKELVMMAVGHPDAWLDEDSTIKHAGGVFTVSTTWENHQEIAGLLKMLNKPVRLGKAGQAREHKAAAGKLKKRMPLTGKALSLKSAIALIREKTDAPIVVMWDALELVNVNPDDTIKPIPNALPADELLEKVLAQASAQAGAPKKADKPVLGITDGVIRITTARDLAKQTRTHIYDIRRLLPKDPAKHLQAGDQIIKQIQTKIGDKDDWLNEDHVAIVFYGNLIIKTTEDLHLQVPEVLKKMR